MNPPSLDAPLEASFAAEYRVALEAYLWSRDEAALERAYDLGRTAILRGLGVVHVVAAHLETLSARQHTYRDLAECLQVMAEAGVFLTECLSPFEMTLRGYQETNQRLRALNDELRQATEATDAANRELETFSYSVAHDLRAPLRSVIGFSEILLDEQASRLDSSGLTSLQRVHAAGKKMMSLVEDLLALAKITRATLRVKEVDLAALAREVFERLRAAEPSRSVELVAPEQLKVKGDAKLLEVVLDNLLGNAWKFTAKRADARIELGQLEGGEERLTFVRDNGAGFDMAYAEKLFGPFQRLHSAAEFEGTGIGLATVQRIISRHGGRIRGEGQLGQGATFYFSLPE